MKNKVLIPAAIAGIALIAASCGKGSSSEFEGFTRSENGLHYKFFNKKEGGTSAKIGDNVLVNYQFKLNRNDSVIMDSKQGSADGSGYAEINLQRSTFAGSLEDGIMMMSAGDSAVFIVNADSFFLKTMGLNELPKFVNKGEYIKANMKVKEVFGKEMVEARQKKQMEEREAMMKEMEGKEQPALEKYLTDNKITAKPRESGLIVIVEKKGSGANAKAGDLVEVNYTGRLLDGKVFDTSVEKVAKENDNYNPQRPYEPIKFQLGKGMVIPGWDEGISLLNKGSKARFIIPSRIAYGGNPAGPIPPFSTLVFDVELVNFGPGPVEPAAPAQPQGK